MSEYIQPHKYLLDIPSDETILYKITSLSNFKDMVEKSYLYFKRVDSYDDDKNDSQATEIDQELAAKSIFLGSQNYSAKEYYDACRTRTYACCFATKLTGHLFTNYYADDKPICLCIKSGELIKTLNSNFDKSSIMHGDFVLKNFFDINHGLVKYGNFKERFMGKHLPNPIEYVFFKDKDKYSEENEFRTSISTLGIGNIVLPNKERFDFPKSITLPFDFIEAIKSNIISEIIIRDGKYLAEVKNIFNDSGVKIQLSEKENI